MRKWIGINDFAKKCLCRNRPPTCGGLHLRMETRRGRGVFPYARALVKARKVYMRGKENGNSVGLRKCGAWGWWGATLATQCCGLLVTVPWACWETLSLSNVSFPWFSLSVCEWCYTLQHALCCCTHWGALAEWELKNILSLCNCVGRSLLWCVWLCCWATHRGFYLPVCCSYGAELDFSIRAMSSRLPIAVKLLRMAKSWVDWLPQCS